MKIKFNKFIKLYESPDSVSYRLLQDVNIGHRYLDWEDKDAISFGYLEEFDNILVSNFHETHDLMASDYGYFGIDRKDMKYPGRLWLNIKVISFWEYPRNYDKLIEILNDIKKEVYKKYKIKIIFDNSWWIEVIFKNNKQIINKYKYWGESEEVGDGRYINDSKLIKIKDYKGSNKRNVKELSKKHIEAGSGDKIPGFGSEYYTKKLPKRMSQSEYKNKKTKYKFTESNNAQFTYNNELNPKFWKNDKFDKRIREKLITIAKEFYENFDYDVPIEDIILTGSLANFNYNKYSDIDVHVSIDFSKINKDIKLVKKAIDGYRFIWNLRHNIKIKGYDVELYIQDINEKHIASGLYSLLNNKWIIYPKYNKPTIDKQLVNFKFLTYKSGIEKLYEISKRNMSQKLAMKNYLYATKYKSKIMKGRKIGLEKGGEFSVENLVFKKLRNSGYFKKLIDIISTFYNKIYSQIQ